jgi:hypothetical protein
MNNTLFKRMALNLTLSFLITLIGNRPAKGSPCIGAGDPTLWTRDDIDLAGNRRRIGGVDLGCYQSERKGFRVIVR